MYEIPARSQEADLGVREVADELLALDPDGSRFSRVFRATFDQLYDGQRTGRYRLDQLLKTEKSHFGSLIEINLQRELGFEDGHVLDYRIANHEVDCKYSHTGAWMLPIESFDQIILVTKADDMRSTWSAGLVRVSLENRRISENRDKKTGLNVNGRNSILWLHKDAPMQPNALLDLTPGEAEQIMEQSSGQARVNTLFRTAVNRRLSRNIVATVAQQDDYMKRVRYNGGARSALQPEGYLILSGDYARQRNLAEDLGSVVPNPGEFVSIQVVPASSDAGVLIDGEWWRLKQSLDRVQVPAPLVR
ncbi:NaeI family type II restriction endonuclease [Flaviflexus equikiangi]|uniref:Type II restriction enzyme NaeI domain-containing protein n=1 Tax=Flaviflexus equikiangi TaxID=2758573 RepID=A0ABS2TIU7_9ACTO|nr:NaeI family type II restriction endonuclease [Flaviflexus equikiangi]MBM9433466.1 hypothetical protein [Flaviflexus equikiangi]